MALSTPALQKIARCICVGVVPIVLKTHNPVLQGLQDVERVNAMPLTQPTTLERATPGRRVDSGQSQHLLLNTNCISIGCGPGCMHAKSVQPYLAQIIRH